MEVSSTKSTKKKKLGKKKSNSKTPNDRYFSSDTSTKFQARSLDDLIHKRKKVTRKNFPKLNAIKSMNISLKGIESNSKKSSDEQVNLVNTLNTVNTSEKSQTKFKNSPMFSKQMKNKAKKARKRTNSGSGFSLKGIESNSKKSSDEQVNLVNPLNTIRNSKKSVFNTSEKSQTKFKNTPMASKQMKKKAKKRKNSGSGLDNTFETSKNMNITKSKKAKRNSKNSALHPEKSASSESEEYSDYDELSGNESDEANLREEIKSSSIFQKIQKLMAKAPELNPNITNSALVSKQNSDDSNAEDLDYSNAENTTDDSSDANLDVISAESSDEDSSVENEEKDSVSVKSDFKSNSRDDNETSNRKLKNPIEKSDKNIDYKILPNKPLETDVKNGFERSKKSPMSTNLKNKVHEKMVAAKFRYLNEKLYTETGRESFQYFNKNTDEFDDYHLGYRQQVSKWPMNPVNEIISDLQKLKKNITIADLGCGEAKIAQVLKNITVHSFDLVPLNEYVKSCDISKVPLPNESVDVAVFCLSLMGVNLKDYLREAFRILKVGGILKIAEVESRIDDLEHFINYLESVGFKLEKKNTKHKMFVFLDLKKEKKQCKTGKLPDFSLKPCLYKKR